MSADEKIMKGLVAKPIIKDQYWVVTDGNQKVGNMVAAGSGFNVNMNGISKYFNNSQELKNTTQIQFQTLKNRDNKIDLPFTQYPTTPKVYNSILDIKRKLHLYTKTSKSKCFYAAGWFAMNQNGSFEPIFCPKYIFIQRYPYSGPYKTEHEAKDVINNL